MTTLTASINRKQFLDENFLLQTKAAEVLYHDFAAKMPIIDFHCHLPPDEIASDKSFANLSKVWLAGDHYKWRAMRTNGVDESYCTGDKSDREKFQKWAETVPYTLRNPLYHWTHLELQRYFDINEVLNPSSAEFVYNSCTEKLQGSEFSVRSLLSKMKVETICTTDDPLDSLEFHQQISASGFGTDVFPTFRPDKFILIDNPAFPVYLQKLGELTKKEISSFEGLLEALATRAEFFASLGGRVSDHGLEQIYADDFTEVEADKVLRKVIGGEPISDPDARLFKSAVLHHLGVLYHKLGWVQQFHVGAMRNNNKRAMRVLGPDTGWDSIGDYPQATALSKFLGRLDEFDQLAKTIIYNLNPADNEIIATMLGNFNDGSVAGKVQFGSGWWFLDQKDGMEKQINALSSMGLVSKFVGMLTDSRSFLSYPRHEYFRRILCNLFGNDIENGELPYDLAWTGKIIQDICYNNAKEYFKV